MSAENTDIHNGNGVKRIDVEFLSQGVTCRAWLYLPPGPPAPVLVMAHGLGATRTMRLDAFAERFAAAGYACFVFDYRYFGDSDGEPRQLLSIRKQQEDWEAALHHVRGRDDVDGGRTVVWGTSFSGGHAFILGAKHPELAAVMAQCPYSSGVASILAANPISAMKVTAMGIADLVGAVFGRPPILAAIVGDAGSASLMTAADAVELFPTFVPDGVEFINAASARVALTLPLHNPGRSHLRKVSVPTLISVCESDSVAPAKPTLKHAAGNPKVRVNRYPDGHFDIYLGEAFERVVADQLAFLREVVPV